MKGLEDFLFFFKNNGNENIFNNLYRGIEREGLRVTPSGVLSEKPHPGILGSALTHPSVTTDFSEALLELVTPKRDSVHGCYEKLKDIHHFVYKHLEEELIWCGSMPSVVKGESSVPIAYYGESNIGRMKTIYREGLKNRYGSLMEIISGIHFNFSFSNEFWDFFKEFLVSQGVTVEAPQKEFISHSYFGLIRNVQKWGWVIPYFFGASPALCGSFLGASKSIPSFLEKFDNKGTYFSPMSTSLRLSGIGYKNSNQDKLNISYNSLREYVDGLQKAINTNYGPWEAIGLKNDKGDFKQLNTNLLQIENEYYSTIRPKRIVPSGTSPSLGLLEKGVEYIELRSLDINPFAVAGISEEQIRFLDIFLIYCLLSERPEFSKKEYDLYEQNFSAVVLGGQDRKLSLFDEEGGRKPLKEQLKSLFSGLEVVVELFDHHTSTEQSGEYRKVLEKYRKVFEGKELSLSELMIQEMKSKELSYSELISSLSKENKKFFTEKEMDSDKEKHFIGQSEKSKVEHLKIERKKREPFDIFVKKYLGR